MVYEFITWKAPVGLGEELPAHEAGHAFAVLSNSFEFVPGINIIGDEHGKWIIMTVTDQQFDGSWHELQALRRDEAKVQEWLDRNQ